MGKRVHVSTDETKKRSREYYAANRERLLKQMKEHRDSNKEIVAARKKAYGQKNKEAISIKKKQAYEANKAEKLRKNKAYRDANREAYLAQKRAYYQLNKANHRARSKAWEKKNPEQARMIGARNEATRRARKRGAVVGDLSLIAEWEKTWRTNKRVKCYWCDEHFAGKDCHSDHVEPLSKGGVHDLLNLVISCPTCNLTKSARSPESFNKMSKKPKLFV